jgi:hypothetical protein
MTPFYQWQTGMPHQYHGHGEVFRNNNGRSYQEYDNITHYHNGHFSKYKKKSKQRNLADVYGYKGCDKQYHGKSDQVDALRDRGHKQRNGFANQHRNNFGNRTSGFDNNTGGFFNPPNGFRDQRYSFGALEHGFNGEVYKFSKRKGNCNIGTNDNQQGGQVINNNRAHFLP